MSHSNELGLQRDTGNRCSAGLRNNTFGKDPLCIYIVLGIEVSLLPQASMRIWSCVGSRVRLTKIYFLT